MDVTGVVINTVTMVDRKSTHSRNESDVLSVAYGQHGKLPECVGQIRHEQEQPASMHF